MALNCQAAKLRTIATLCKGLHLSQIDWPLLAVRGHHPVQFSVGSSSIYWIVLFRLFGKEYRTPPIAVRHRFGAHKNRIANKKNPLEFIWLVAINVVANQTLNP